MVAVVVTAVEGVDKAIETGRIGGWWWFVVFVCFLSIWVRFCEPDRFR